MKQTLGCSRNLSDNHRGYMSPPTSPDSSSSCESSAKIQQPPAIHTAERRGLIDERPAAALRSMSHGCHGDRVFRSTPTSSHARTFSFDTGVEVKEEEAEVSTSGADSPDHTHRRTWSGGLHMMEKFISSLTPLQRRGSGRSLYHTRGSYGSIEEERKDYHDRNQAFLREARHAREKEMEQQIQHPRSTPQSRRYQRMIMSSSHSPITRMPLKPIGDDDWEDEDDTPKRSKVDGIMDRRQSSSPDETRREQSGYETSESSNDEQTRRKGEFEKGDLCRSTRGSRRGNQESLSSSNSSKSASSGSKHEMHMKELVTEPGIATQESDNASSFLHSDKGKSTGKSKHKHARKDREKKKKQKQREEMEQILIDEMKKQRAKRKKRSKKEQDRQFRRHLSEERQKFIQSWKEEYKKEQEERRWHNRFRKWIREKRESGVDIVASTETFISNLPLTVGACALAWVTMGVVWFKFAEENLDSCTPVHFNSPQCTFPEFPGCFICREKGAFYYRLALYFHYLCDVIAGTLAISFFAKIALAWRVVVDELSHPTTSRPCGMVCITMVCVFAGRGKLGEAIVLSTSFMHLCLVFWSFYMAWSYRALPEPSWYPNTVGSGYAAIKTFLYHPHIGQFLMVISYLSFIVTYPLSMIRVALNKKISAPVCWIQMSGPSQALYALTIMAQPTYNHEMTIQNNPFFMEKFKRLHHAVYLPCMHLMFVLSVLAVLSAVQGLWVRFDSIKKKPFSPAHLAFTSPTLCHANAVQAYRGAVDSFSTIPLGTPFKIVIYVYWLIVLVGGTITTIIISLKFFWCLPKWTQVDVAGEEEPPAPDQTMVHDLISTGETLRQPFVSPEVLQANEAGALVRVRRGREDWRGSYVRTRQIPALGFEPTMDWSELNAERETLLDWVAQNPPTVRKRTMSFPHLILDNLSGHGSPSEADQLLAGPAHRRCITDIEAPWA